MITSWHAITLLTLQDLAPHRSPFVCALLHANQASHAALPILLQTWCCDACMATAIFTDHMPFTITLLHAVVGAGPVHTSAWDGVVSICHYLRFLCNQLFLPFTLCKSYLLLLHHVRQAHVRSNNCSSTMLHRDIDPYTSKHPHATQQQIMQHVLKHTIAKASQ